MLGLLFNSYMKALCEVQHSPTPPSRSTVVDSKMPQQVLESLFKVPEQVQRAHDPSKMDWKKIVKKLQSYNHPITPNNQGRQKNGMSCFLSLCLPIVQGLICVCLLWCSIHCHSRFHFFFFRCGKLAMSQFFVSLLYIGSFRAFFLPLSQIASSSSHNDSMYTHNRHFFQYIRSTNLVSPIVLCNYCIGHCCILYNCHFSTLRGWVSRVPWCCCWTLW